MSICDTFVTRNIMAISEKETEFLSILASKNQSIFGFAEAEKYLGFYDATKSSLKRLAQKGRIKRIEKGKYLVVPLEAGPEKEWAENAFIIANEITRIGAIAYWSALRLWNLTEQLPRAIFIQSPERKRDKKILNMDYKFITIKKSRFFGITAIEMSGQRVRVTDVEKSIIDGLSRPELSGGISTMAAALQVSVNEINWKKMHSYLEKWEGGTVPKRLGYLIKFLNLSFLEKPQVIKGLKRMMTEGISELEPGLPQNGPIDTSWRIKDNVFFSEDKL